MRMIAAFLLLVLPFASLAAPVPTAQQPEYSMQVTGDLEVAADGSVHGYTLDEGLKPKVEELVAASIDRWKFEPILVEGRPVIARTRLRMTLKAEPFEQGYRLRIENVWFGEPTRTSLMDPPRYPTAAARVGLSARVVLVLKLDSAGNVTAVHPEQTSLSAKISGKTAGVWRRRFEIASIEAASKWKFDMAEVIDGAPMDGSIRVPVDFMMGSSGIEQWHGYFPGPITSAPWAETGQQVASASDQLGNGQVQPLYSRFRLTTEVMGAVL